MLKVFIPLQLGGMNSLLSDEHSGSIPIVLKVPTLISGMDVSHGSPGQSDIPSILNFFVSKCIRCFHVGSSPNFIFSIILSNVI